MLPQAGDETASGHRANQQVVRLLFAAAHHGQERALSSNRRNDAHMRREGEGQPQRVDRGLAVHAVKKIRTLDDENDRFAVPPVGADRISGGLLQVVERKAVVAADAEAIGMLAEVVYDEQKKGG